MVPIFGKKFKRTMAFILIFMMVFSTPTMALGSDLDLGGIDQGDNLGGDNPGGGDDDVIGDDDDDVIGDDDDDVIGDDDDDVIGDDDDDVIGDDDDDVIGDDDDDVIGDDDDDVIGEEEEEEEEEETLLGPVNLAMVMAPVVIPGPASNEYTVITPTGSITVTSHPGDSDSSTTCCEIDFDKTLNSGNKTTWYIFMNPRGVVTLQDKNTAPDGFELVASIYYEQKLQNLSLVVEKDVKFGIRWKCSSEYAHFDVDGEGEYLIPQLGNSFNQLWFSDGHWNNLLPETGSLIITKTVDGYLDGYEGDIFTFTVTDKDEKEYEVSVTVGADGKGQSSPLTLPVGEFNVSENDADGGVVEVDDEFTIGDNIYTLVSIATAEEIIADGTVAEFTNKLEEEVILPPGCGKLKIEKTVEGLPKGEYT